MSRGLSVAECSWNRLTFPRRALALVGGAPTRDWPAGPIHQDLKRVRIMFGIETLIVAEITRIAGLVLAMVIGGAGVDTLPIAFNQAEPQVSQGCEIMAPRIDAEPWVRTELFFGTAKPDGTAISEAEWQAFVDAEMTPRFPDGLTVLSGSGQWQGDDDEIVQERSKIVILLYPREAITESNAEIEEIRTAYEREFQQESVLRADDERPVCASF
jgi:hypothetical protein